MARTMKRSRTEYESRGPSDDDMPVEEETTSPRRSSEAQRRSTKKNKNNKGKMITILVKLKDETSEMRKLFGNFVESNSNQSKMVEKLIESHTYQSISLEKLTESHNDLRKLFGDIVESNNNQSKMLEKLIESHTYQSRSLETLTESHNGIRKQWELQNNAPRSQWNQEQPPRYRLVFRSKVTGEIEKGKTIEIHVALVDANNGQTVKNGPLASVTVELVVIDAKFNENDNEYNWSREDFVSNIVKAPQGKSATVNVDHSIKSIVSKGRFNLENGDKCHSDSAIFNNPSNKKVRLGAIVVSPTQERVLEGLSDPFFVRGHDRPNRRKPDNNGNQEQNGPTSNVQNQSCPNSTQADGNGKPVNNGNQEQNGPTSNVQNQSCPNSPQADGNGSAIPPVFRGQHQLPFQRNIPEFFTEPASSQGHQVTHCPMLAPGSNNTTGLNGIEETLLQFTGDADNVSSAWRAQSEDDWRNIIHERMYNTTGTSFFPNESAFPVRLVVDMPNVVPRKHCFNILDHLPLHNWQQNFKNCPTTRLMQEHFGSLTIMPKEVTQTRRGRGVLIESLEPDDSDDGQPLKRMLHSKYQLRFVNKVCSAYYTRDQIKADDGNLLKVALFDENNMKITSGPLSSASVEVVALHGDFNGDGQDDWTSEEFNCSVVFPPPGEEASSVLGGDRILVLAGGEACLGDVFFQRTSFCARTGKFKMGVMLASAQEERIQEGISEPFQVMDHHVPGFISNCSSWKSDLEPPVCRASTSSGEMAEALLDASMTANSLANKPTKTIIRKLLEIVANLKELKRKVEELQRNYKERNIPDKAIKHRSTASLNLHGSAINTPPDSIGELESLMYLDLTGYPLLIPETVAKLRKLHKLNLSSCSKLERLLGMENLRYLHVSGCHNLDMSTLPQYRKSSNLLQNFVVHAGDGEFSSNLWKLEYEHPPFLQIANLENVKSVEEAQRIKLVEKQSLRNLCLEWTQDAKRLVDDTELLNQLMPPHTLEEFLLQGYDRTSFPSWMMNITTYLPRLTKIKLKKLPSCNKLPPFGQLPNLECPEIEGMDGITKIDGDLYGGTSAFPQLRSFCLKDMECLEEWSTAYPWSEEGLSQLVFPKLKYLDISTCPKLRLISGSPLSNNNNMVLSIYSSDKIIQLPLDDRGHVGGASYFGATTTLNVDRCEAPLHRWSLLRHLPYIRNLRIEDCSDLTCSSADILQGLTSLQTLHVGSCESIVALPEWLGDLTSLVELEVYDCGGIMILPESIRQLKFLQYLDISGCSNLAALPEGLGDLMSLEKLEVHNCEGIKTLPESIQQLKCLRRLDINGCSKLVGLPERLEELTSLVELVVWDCEGIKTLPKSIQQLKCLQRLEISGCSKLVQWCRSRKNKMKLIHIKQIILNFQRWDPLDSDDEETESE